VGDGLWLNTYLIYINSMAIYDSDICLIWL
ncbi:MAG: hypothetical protein ACI8RD_011225, partial [Bacillariaceae sp.]